MFYHKFDDITIDMFDDYYNKKPHMYKHHEKYFNSFDDQYTYFANHYIPEDFDIWRDSLTNLKKYERQMYAKVDVKNELLVISYYQLYNTNITLINRYIENLDNGLGYHYSLKNFKSVGYALYAANGDYHMGGWTDYDRFYSQRQRKLDANSINALKSLERFKYLPIELFKFISVYKLFQVSPEAIYQYEILLKNKLVSMATDLHLDRSHISKSQFIKYKKDIMSGIRYKQLQEYIYRDERVERERKEKLQLRAMIAAFNKMPKLKWEYNDFIFKTPESYDELKKEGRELKHCVATYVEKIIDGQTKVILMRKKDNPDTPYFTIELKDKHIQQVRTMHNASDVHIKNIVQEWVQTIWS